jgi:ATP-dependent Lon protease
MYRKAATLNGPSAGIAMLTSLVSVLQKVKRKDKCNDR